MSQRMKMIWMYMVTIVILISQLVVASPVLAKKKNTMVQDLIIFQNIPQTETIAGNLFVLKAIYKYEDGHFEHTTSEVKWQSTNPKVAKVDQLGNVEFTGTKGSAQIKVSKGKLKDRIGVRYKEQGELVKKKGKRYDVIDQAIKKMTLEEKIGQMLMPDFRTWKGSDVTKMLPEIEALVKKYHLGGVILFRENVVSTEQTARLVADYQEAADKYGMLVTIDQEGGVVTRLQSGTDMPGNMALGATRSTELASRVGLSIGEELASLGINMNFAPDLDVNNNPDNPVIGVRSFGGNPKLVAELGTAYAKGLQAAGVAATAKHFPGHGDTAVDSHLGLPEVPYDKERLKEVELYPFQIAMEANIDTIMTAHVTFPKIDDTKAISQKTGEEIALPATLSYKVLTELMRNEMKFEGVITTDAMNMNAIAEHFGSVDAAIRAVKAGTDIVLMPVGLEDVASGLVKAVKTKDLSEKRIEQSVERILTLKLKRGIMKEESPQPIEEKIAYARSIVGSLEHKQIEKEVAEQSITLVKNNYVLPLQLNEGDEIVVLGRTYLIDLANAVKKHHQHVTVVEANADYTLSPEQWERIRDAKVVIIGSHTSTVAGRSIDNPQMRMINHVIAETSAPVIGIGIRNPYDVMAFPEIDSYLAMYGFRPVSFEAAGAAIFGKITPQGKLPVSIPTLDGGMLYEYGHGLTF
ncbi:beta-N-acetylhexosaminidase [Peribacillus huizhouensis]|uniref:beta-N-acetylhexosaminidase n=2 Tax=Peribacillus huizhouensis TaxID=1501239 RepID=A0ABR6CK98_9BACI|nr:glycoside hydrolase family 3 protein [Peribacillus huizhouensis]MBA9025329.1 beta-N-acetylhexosaminidase [Peribacillus huizhouensis]